MVMEKTILDKNRVATRVKHVALTGFLRKNWKRDPRYVQQIISDCDVSTRLGELPPQLRERVDKTKISEVTDAFHVNLQNFLSENIWELDELPTDKVYDLPELGNLFNTKCELLARGYPAYGVNPWSGANGFVCKMSFPMINAHYALKLYYEDGRFIRCCDHGVWFEIPTALAAGRAEPRDNNRIYMAALTGGAYLLSHWGGDNEDKIAARKNENMIFVTSLDEDESRNRRGGRRIDWGETFLTDYGAMSYPARKVYRQIMACDQMALKKSCDMARGAFACRDIETAVRLADLTAFYDGNVAVEKFLDNFLQR